MMTKHGKIRIYIYINIYKYMYVYIYICNVKLRLINPAVLINHNWPRKCLQIKNMDPQDQSTPLINQPPLLKAHFLDSSIS